MTEEAVAITWGCCLGINLKGMRETTKNFRQDSWYQDRGSNRLFPEHKSAALKSEVNLLRV
jgi:hypothetical protein